MQKVGRGGVHIPYGILIVGFECFFRRDLTNWKGDTFVLSVLQVLLTKNALSKCVWELGSHLPAENPGSLLLETTPGR